MKRVIFTLLLGSAAAFGWAQLGLTMAGCDPTAGVRASSPAPQSARRQREEPRDPTLSHHLHVRRGAP